MSDIVWEMWFGFDRFCVQYVSLLQIQKCVGLVLLFYSVGAFGGASGFGSGPTVYSLLTILKNWLIFLYFYNPITITIDSAAVSVTDPAHIGI